MRRPGESEEATAAAERAAGGPRPSDVPVAGVRVDASGRIIQWDAAAEAMLGYPAAELLGSRGELLVPPAGSPGTQSLPERISDGRDATGPCTARHRDGHVVELAVWTYQVPAGGDMLAFLLDVTAASEMRTSRAVLDGLFRHSPIGLSAFDAELRYLRVNAALEAINGVAEAEHLGRRLSDVLPEVKSGEVEAVLRRVLDTGEPVVGFRRAPRARTGCGPVPTSAWRTPGDARSVSVPRWSTSPLGSGPSWRPRRAGGGSTCSVRAAPV
ncbi:PAS domain-containing protein [Streptomyces sp. IBSNAI002]|uniref:PAS domain-containing protein n=1 Tax=Streptomyces sp. IBSNAI002 TaxID=3457500 RepID=UPI003FD5869B